MEGPKRLEFTTIASPGNKEKKITTQETRRFDLDLSDSTETACSEFFYSDLLKAESSNEKSKYKDPLGDPDDVDKLTAFEDKYNKSTNEKKKKKQKWHDNYYLVALGEGYDENDTFIDNSEAYDEILPETKTTKLGGFYINAGILELKEMSDLSDDEFASPAAVKTNKKRRISSDSNSGDEQTTVKKIKVKDTLSLNGEVKKRKKKHILPGEKCLKKPKVLDKPKDNKTPSVSALIKSTSPNINGEPHVNGLLSSTDCNHGSNEKSELKSNISMVIDSVIAMAAKDDSNSRSDFEEKKNVDPENSQKLPLNLPSGIEKKINLLKNQAQEYMGEKSGKFFTETVNHLLLEVEMASKQMPVSNRSAMYAHLAAFLPCSKDTLLKRAKRLRVKELEDKIKGPMEKLRQAVDCVMPALCQKFEEDCRVAALERLEESNKEENKKEETEGKEEGGTESDEEKTNLTDSAKKRQHGPRKKFVWDSNIISLLCDVVRVKMHTYHMSKGRSQTAEEYCKAFLDQDVRPLWPKGWMQTRVLYKESRSAHMVWTNPQKPKKGLITTLASKTQRAPLPTNTQVMKAPDQVPKISSAQKTTNNISSFTSGTKVSKSIPGAMCVPPVTVTAGNIHDCQTADYTNNNPGSVDTMQKNTSPNVIKSSQQSSACSPVPGIATVTDTRMQGPTEMSWNHVVSDILRDSISDPHTGTTMPKSYVQRQNSNMISNSQGANSFYAQFEKYAATAASEMAFSPTRSQPSPTQISPRQSMADHQKKLHEHQQLQQHIEKEKIRQLNLLKETQMNQGLRYQGTLAQKEPGQKQPQSNSQSKQLTSQNVALLDGIDEHHTTSSLSSNQLTSKFQHGNNQNVALLNHNFLRHQVGGSQFGSQVSSSKGNLHQQVKLVNPITQEQVAESFGNLTSSEILRKTSSQGIGLSKHSMLQAGSHQGHSQGSKNQSPVLYNPGSVTIATVTAANLLKSLIAQSGGQSSSMHSPPKMSASPPGSTLKARNTPQQMSPVNIGQTNYLSSSLSSAMQYTVPVTSMRPVPGYQSIKLNNFAGEQMTALQAAHQSQTQNSGNIFTAMMSPRQDKK